MTRVRGRSKTKVRFDRFGAAYLLFILCRLRGECSVPALLGFFLERCLEVLVDDGLLLFPLIFAVFSAFVGCEFVPCGLFLPVPGFPVPALIVPETADTTVPTAVPTFWATSVKTPGSAGVDSLVVSLRPFVFIRYLRKLSNFDASFACQVAMKLLEWLKPARM